VLVFPLLPVIAITFPVNLFLENCAIFINAIFVSFTNRPLYLSAIFLSDTITPEAPFDIAELIKS